MILLGTLSNFVQFIVVLLIFLFVLALTYITTKFVGKYQQGNMLNKNIKVIETYRVTNNKFIQICQIGKKYVTIAVCKDTITKICELSEDEILEFPGEGESLNTGLNLNFEDIFSKVKEQIKKNGRNE